VMVISVFGTGCLWRYHTLKTGARYWSFRWQMFMIVVFFHGIDIRMQRVLQQWNKL